MRGEYVSNSLPNIVMCQVPIRMTDVWNGMETHEKIHELHPIHQEPCTMWHCCAPTMQHDQHYLHISGFVQQ